jgi:trans-aconitate methyltransferase
MTVLKFHHLGWDPHSAYLGFCSQAWAETLVLLRRWAEARTPGQHSAPASISHSNQQLPACAYAVAMLQLA